MKAIQRIALILFPFTIIYGNVWSQASVRLTDGRYDIDLKKGMPVAYLLFGDSMVLSKHHKKTTNETSRYGTIFRTDTVTDFDSTSILFRKHIVSYDSIRVIYHNKANLGAKITGGAMMAGGLYLILSSIDTKQATQNEEDASRIWLGIGGLAIGSFLCFHNFNHVVQWDAPNHIVYFF